MLLSASLHSLNHLFPLRLSIFIQKHQLSALSVLSVCLKSVFLRDLVEAVLGVLTHPHLRSTVQVSGQPAETRPKAIAAFHFIIWPLHGLHTSLKITLTHSS